MQGARRLRPVLGFVFLACLAYAVPGAAHGVDGPSLTPQAECLQAARAAEARHGLPHGLLVAIALAESGLHAYALNIGGRSYFAQDAATAKRLIASAPARASIMAGCVQVNARVHAQHADWPLDARRATDWAARLLRGFYADNADWAEAIRRWNGAGGTSANGLVCRVRAKLQVVNPVTTILDGHGCRAAQTARVARDATALLEVAEAPSD